MTREEAIEALQASSIKQMSLTKIIVDGKYLSVKEALEMAIKALEQEPKTGQWIRMSDLSEQEDDRYKCSHCGNIIHHKNKMNLYTFNSWCGRCGSDNGR